MKKKILFILNSLPVGGAEKQTIALVNALSEEDFDLSLVYNDAIENLLPQIDAKRLTVLECLYRKKRLDRGVLKKIRRLMQDKKYDIVVCVGPYPMIYAFLCRLFSLHKFGIILIFHLTIPRPDIWTKIKNKFLYKYLMNRCEKIVFVCKNQMDFWVDNFSIRRDKSVFIYNGVDVAFFADIFSDEQKQILKESYGFRSDDFVVGICATLRPEKNHTDFVDAIELAQGKIPNIKGLIVGDGVLYDVIQRYIEAKGMALAIKMAGFQNDVRPCISICDCMALTSHEIETFSVSVLESMAMAKPIVITDIGGAGEQIEHGISGFLYKKGDVRELAACLVTLHKSKGCARMGAKARERVCSRFSIDKMLKDYTQIFNIKKY